ncbi:MAG TPA: 50S ribosomal protein L30 [candidate division Zixibacteria bacterium]|nr:50S ribosomal protein L30 [candidate division Zixibacteria bacterium]
MERVRITLTRSPIGYNKRQKATVKGLGLKKIRQTVEHDATESIKGMIYKIRHLVEVEVIGNSGGE